MVNRGLNQMELIRREETEKKDICQCSPTGTLQSGASYSLGEAEQGADPGPLAPPLGARKARWGEGTVELAMGIEGGQAQPRHPLSLLKAP